MLRVLTLSTLFPNAVRPTLGVFVERQTLGLAAYPEVELQAVSPVGLPLWPASVHPHYAPLRALPAREGWKGLIVHRPPYRVWPVVGQAGTARRIAAALLPRLKELRRTFPFDVIDAQFFWPDGPAAMHLSRALGVPFSVKARGADIAYWAHRPGIAPQIVEASREAAGLLAVSAALKADMAALGMPEEKIRVHHTGVDLDLFRPIDRAAAKGRLDVDGPLIVTPGALIERKGQAFAITALEQLPGATLLLVGDGPDRRKLEAQVRAAGLTGRVRFLSRRRHEELPGLLGAADLMLLPTAFEGIANVWVESLACGTPVVTCDVGGAREVFTTPESGRLVARDPEALAAAARDLLAAPPPPDQVRKAAESFSWERNTAELFGHLSSLRR